MGLVGIAFVIATARSLARIPGWLGTGLLAGFLGYVVAASFNNPFIFIRVSAVVFSMVGVGLALAERARAPATGDAVAIATDAAVAPTDAAGDTTPDTAVTASEAAAEPTAAAAEPTEAAAEPTEAAAEPTDTLGRAARS